MNLKKLAKKITASLAVLSLGIGITFSTPAEAFSIGDAVVIAGGALQMSQVNKQVDELNNTEEGRQKLYQEFRKKYGVNDDPELNARLDKIMSDLTKAVGQTDSSIYEKPYLYFVSAEESLNAACGMGHVMMVNTGAFTYLRNDDEIAAVVGHEMGHGQKNHVAKGIKSNMNKQLLAQIGASAAGGGTLVNAVASIALINSVAHGDRKKETEADNLAWDYIIRTNYNPGACAAVQQKFVEMFGEKNKSSILNPSDHPDSDKRRDNYVNKLYEYSNKHATAKDGVVTVNGKTFTTVAAAQEMSSAERAYFILGNLAAAYHNGHSSSQATVVNGTVMLGAQPIITPAEGDEDAYTLAARLNEIK